jgi:hypothetical protein
VACCLNSQQHSVVKIKKSVYQEEILMFTLNCHSIEVDFAAGFLHHGCVDSIADFCELHFSFIFRNEMRRLHEC